jgi:hypothetical protein
MTKEANPVSPIKCHRSLQVAAQRFSVTFLPSGRRGRSVSAEPIASKGAARDSCPRGPLSSAPALIGLTAALRPPDRLRVIARSARTRHVSFTLASDEIVRISRKAAVDDYLPRVILLIRRGVIHCALVRTTCGMVCNTGNSRLLLSLIIADRRVAPFS